MVEEQPRPDVPYCARIWFRWGGEQWDEEEGDGGVGVSPEIVRRGGASVSREGRWLVLLVGLWSGNFPQGARRYRVLRIGEAYASGVLCVLLIYLCISVEGARGSSYPYTYRLILVLILLNLR